MICAGDKSFAFEVLLLVNTEKIVTWLKLSKLHQHGQGLMPFLLGGVLSWKVGGNFSWVIFFLAMFAAYLILQAANFAGEYFDYKVDTLARYCRNKFSGGTQVFQTTDMIPRHYALYATYICIALAGFIGLLLQFYFKTGRWTIALGILGMIGGFFYSHKPIQWAYRGLGEFWIWFNYGWLSVATPYYLMNGEIPLVVHLLSMPAAFTVFNIIVINEFPDYPADKAANKKNLVVRFGLKKMSYVYVAAGILTWVFVVLGVFAGAPRSILIGEIPVLSMSIWNMYQVLREDYKDRTKLESICLRTILWNMSLIAVIIICYIVT